MLELKMIGQNLAIFVVLTSVGILLSYWKIRRIERELQSMPFEPNYCLLPGYEAPNPHRRKNDEYPVPPVMKIDDVEAPKWASKKLGEKV